MSEIMYESRGDAPWNRNGSDDAEQGFVNFHAESKAMDPCYDCRKPVCDGCEQESGIGKDDMPKKGLICPQCGSPHVEPSPQPLCCTDCGRQGTVAEFDPTVNEALYGRWLVWLMGADWCQRNVPWATIDERRGS